MLKSAVWFSTMICNYKCPYCVLTKTPNWEIVYLRDKPTKHAPIRPASEWLKVFNRLRPAVLDITGGEPFYMPDLVEFIEGLEHTQIAMTSNLSMNMDSFFKSDSARRKVFSMTLSFHPSQGMDEHKFLERALKLREAGIPSLTVNFVAYPEQIARIPEYKKHFSDAGFNFHVEPFVRNDGIPSYTEEEKDFLAPYVTPDRKPDTEKGATVLCDGGIHHLSIQADGTAYRCLLDAQLGLAPVGNVFDEDFMPASKSTLCENRFDCRGCDRDKVNIARV